MQEKWFQISFDELLESKPDEDNGWLMVRPKEDKKKPPFWDGFGEELAPPPNETNHIIEVDPCQ